MTEADQVIDVQRLVAELKERVERKRAEGAYTEPFAQETRAEDVVVKPAVVPQPPASLPSVAQSAAPPRITFLPGDRYRSPRKVVGALISFARRIVLRLVHPALDDVARQADAAVLALHARVEQAERAVIAEAEARAALVAEFRSQQDALLQRYDELRAQHDELGAQHDELGAQQEKLRAQHDDLRAQHDDLRAQHDDLRVQRDELRVQHDELRVQHDELRVQHDALAERHHVVRELHDDLGHRQGERLERLETAARAFHASTADTIRGISEHARTLDARADEIVRRLSAVGEQGVDDGASGR